jgi:hypothetical protein
MFINLITNNLAVIILLLGQMFLQRIRALTSAPPDVSVTFDITCRQKIFSIIVRLPLIGVVTLTGLASWVKGLDVFVLGTVSICGRRLPSSR